MSNQPQLRTLEEANRWFSDYGVTVTQWAQEHGFKKEAVYAVLQGRNLGYRGDGHHIAIALGIKAQPTHDPALAQLKREDDAKPRDEITSIVQTFADNVRWELRIGLENGESSWLELRAFDLMDDGRTQNYGRVEDNPARPGLYKEIIKSTADADDLATTLVHDIWAHMEPPLPPEHVRVTLRLKLVGVICTLRFQYEKRLRLHEVI